jgi:hypothetical protein
MRSHRLAGLIVVLTLTLAATTKVSHAQGSEPVPFQMTGLELDLRVDYHAKALDGTATLHVRNASPRPARTIPLLLGRLMHVSRIRASGRGDASFTQRVTVFRDDSIRQVNAITVTLANALAPGDSATIAVSYRGILVGYTETGSLYIRDAVDHDFTIIREDAFAFPTLGVPSSVTNRTISRVDFSYRARITVPKDLVVAAAGPPVKQERDSLVTWIYEGTGRVPFLNITIAAYAVREGPLARIYYFPADSTGASIVDAAVSGAVRQLSTWYGDLGQIPKLTVMEIPAGFGSQASLTGGILQTADAFRDRGQLYQLYHELSHLWNAPDADRPSSRWNEGLASFLQWRLAGELDGWNDWDAQVARTTQRLRRRCTSEPRCLTVPMVRYGAERMTDFSYPVGMLMFVELYRTLGPERFDRAYREFFQQYRGRGATTAQLIATFGQSSPDAERVFAEWMRSAQWSARLSRQP